MREQLLPSLASAGGIVFTDRIDNAKPYDISGRSRKYRSAAPMAGSTSAVKRRGTSPHPP